MAAVGRVSIVKDAGNAALRVAVLVSEPGVPGVAIATRDGAAESPDAIATLPLADRSVEHIGLGDCAATLSVRDQLRLLMECRRSLRASGRVQCVESAAPQTYATLARWAEFAGLVADEHMPGSGWRKREHPHTANPLVSILIPSSNPAYFGQALDSALAQTYRNIEIIICDDCESDAVGEIARSRSDPRVRYIKNPERLRARRNYEKLLGLASGEFVKYLNDDDALAPACVATFVDAFQRVPDLVLATSHRWRIDSASNLMADMPATRPVLSGDRVIDGVSLGNAVTMYGLNFIGEPSTAMFRRSDFAPRPHVDGERPFHFNGEEIRGAADLAMWSRLLVQGNVAFFSERLSYFRTHTAQAQARGDVVSRSVEGIRGLQQQWIRLGLFLRWPPHLIRCQSLTSDYDPTAPWHVEALLGLPHAGLPPDEAVRVWRAVERHPFDV
jgi:glycosyltransferase involved in cell wall biosynthesis